MEESLYWLGLCFFLFLWGLIGYLMWLLEMMSQRRDVKQGYNSSPFSDEPDPRRNAELPSPDPKLRSYDERGWRYPKDSTGARKHKPKGSEEEAE